ncbi:MAG: SH3 domain-containing protein [Clostridium sp.]|uniref:SH3 domain-containing protein n=1 Tax=Clostridium sp. TaxID=1506 RepID=UPI003EE58B4A
MNLKAYVCFNGGPFTYVQKIPQWGVAHLAGKLNNGTEITVISEENDWYQIKFEESTAWIPVARVFFPLVGMVSNINPAESMPSTSSNPDASLYTNGNIVTLIGEGNSNYTVLLNDSTPLISTSNIEIQTQGYILFEDGPYTDVMSSATWDSNCLTTLNNGTGISIIGETNGWYQISFENLIGWIPTPRVYYSNNTFIPLVGTIQTSSGKCNVQGTPSLASPNTITQYSNNKKTYIIGRNNDWYHIINGTSTGWVQCSNVSINKRAFISFIDGPYTDVMSSATWNSNCLTTLNNGTGASIIGEQSGWYQISTTNLIGWVPVERVYVSTNNFISVTGTITKETTIQSAPSSNSTLSIGSCSLKQDFIIYNQFNGWYQIQIKDSIAWIPCGSVELLTFKAD